MKESKLAPADIGHWSTGNKGDGKIYLNDVARRARLTSEEYPTR